MDKKHKIILAALLTAVIVFAAGKAHSSARANGANDFNDADFLAATQAALLDPRCWKEVSTTSGKLDVTVPAGHTWYTTNSFAVTFGDTQFASQDNYPNSRRSGFIRPLDVRQTMPIPGGTRIKNNAGINTAYVFYCDPQTVWDIDARYTMDPSGLRDSRLRQLAQLPVRSAVLEVTGGGSIDDDVHLDLDAFDPVTHAPLPIMVIGTSVYDASWLTIGCADNRVVPLNVMDEINNSHAVRFGHSTQQPIDLSCPLRVVLRKGTLGDTIGPAASPTGVPYSINPAIAYPIHGSGSIVYQVLPSGW